MDNKASAVSLKTILAADGRFQDLLLRDAAPVLCVNRETGKSRVMSFKALHTNNSSFWREGGGSWTFFLAADVLEEFRKKLADSQADHASPEGEVKEKPPGKAPETPPEQPAGNGFGQEYDAISAMTEEERLEKLGENKKRLDEFIAKKGGGGEALTEALVDASRDAALTNRATILEAMQLADGEAKKHTQSLVDTTRALIKSSTQLIGADIFNDEMMNTLVAKSNGTVIQHMTRVFLQGLSFLSYYNKLVTSSSIINKLRISFEEKYRNFYRLLLPHLPGETITLEKVFYGGMRAIPENEFLNWATGFLIHDIGKAAAVEYHEGEAAYNRDIVVEHVKVGFTSVMNKTNYPRDAGLITGYHHEYYGDSGGYGYFRAGLEQHRKNNPDSKQDYCISYELEPVLTYQTLAYFPAKVLEIIDVYDSVTDPNRKYRKAMNPEEALAMMREEFIDKHPKIDMILFDIFAGLIREKPGR